MNRKSAPRVKGGRVQKKNNWTETVTNDGERLPLIDRRRPKEGYRHLLKRRDIEEFISILPDWSELSIGLRAVVLSSDDDSMGWIDLGKVGICAWDAELWWDDADPTFVESHRVILDRLGVEIERRKKRLTVK